MILRWRTEPTLKIDDVRSKTQSPAHPLRKLFLPEYTQKSPNNLQNSCTSNFVQRISNSSMKMEKIRWINRTGFSDV